VDLAEEDNGEVGGVEEEDNREKDDREEEGVMVTQA